MTQTSGLKKEKKLMEFIAGHSYKVEIQENEYPIFDTNGNNTGKNGIIKNSDMHFTVLEF